MTTTQATPRAPLAIRGAYAARRQMQRTALVARQLNQIAPGATRVRVVPVDVAGRAPKWVTLDGPAGPVEADYDAHRDAYRLLRHLFPAADWSSAQTYDAAAGRFVPYAPTPRDAAAVVIALHQKEMAK
ncbi:hypothetical protein ACWENS_05425 [Streptomyces sp. NPDC004532]